MDDVISAVKGVFDTLNPFSLGNLIVYFAWLVIYVFTLVAIWRSNNRWIRLLCLILNQVFALGMFVSYTLAIVLTVTYWQAALATAVGTVILSWWLFRQRKPREETGDRVGDAIAPRDHASAPGLPGTMEPARNGTIGEDRSNG